MDEHRCSEMETILKVHRARIDDMEKLLQDINSQLTHLKGIAYGACGVLVASELGIIEAIKL
jgi:hypothetical protein